MSVGPWWPVICWAAVLNAQIAAPPQIVLRPGEAYQFAGKCPMGHNCAFELLPGHADTSSITFDGMYTAPSAVESHGSLGGCPVLPHNSIYNTRVDEMPVHVESGSYIAALRDTSTYPLKNIHFGAPGIVPNLLGDKVASYSIRGRYSSKWDGDYPLSTPPTVAFGSQDDPKARVQTGWAVPGLDNHYIGVNRDTCVIEEFYKPSAPGAEYKSCSGCTAGGAAVYPSMTFSSPDGIAGKNATTTIAMGGWLAPLQLSQLELVMAVKQQGTGAMLKHALAITVSNAALSKKAVAWPGTQPAYSGSGIVPYGTRLRLKASFIDSYDPKADSSSPVVQAYVMAILRTLQHYGAFVMDGTVPSDAWGIHVRSERFDDQEVEAAFYTLTRSKQLMNNQLINAVEVVDESSYQISPLLDVVRNPSAHPEAVIYRDVTTGAMIDVRDIAVRPPTIGTMQAQYNVLAGAPPIDMTRDVFATGLADNTAIAWSVSPEGGSISAAGVYTPPDDIAAPASFTVRASALEDARVYVDVRVVVFPRIGSGLYVRNTAARGKSANMQEGGRTWWSADASGKAINVTGVQGYGDPWPIAVAAVDGTPYPASVYSNTGNSGEQVFSIYAPNGKYRVVFLVSTAPAAAKNAAIEVELNGTVARRATRIGDFTPGPGRFGFPLEFPAVVTNGELVIGWKSVAAPGGGILAGFIIRPDSPE